MKNIRLFLVDDEPQVRQGLRMRLEMEPGFDVVGEAGDGPTALAAIPGARPDVILMDIDMPGGDGIALTREVRSVAPGSAVVIVTMYDDADIRARAFAAGASGFVSKHEIDAALIDAIRHRPGDSVNGGRSCH